MANQNLTHLMFLLDRSGSMQSIKTDVIGGFHAFVEEQRTGDGQCTATLAQFDNEYEVVYRSIPLADVPQLVLEPRGSTALLDSIGRLITAAAIEINELSEDDKPGTVIVAVMTDGFENASREWRQPDIKALVEQQSNEFGWEFLYMGANQNAVEVGKGLGVKAEQSITYSRGKSREAMGAVSNNVRKYRNAKIRDCTARMPEFSDEQRSRASGD